MLHLVGGRSTRLSDAGFPVGQVFGVAVLGALVYAHLPGGAVGALLAGAALAALLLSPGARRAAC